MLSAPFKFFDRTAQGHVINAEMRTYLGHSVRAGKIDLEAIKDGPDFR